MRSRQRRLLFRLNERPLLFDPRWFSPLSWAGKSANQSKVLCLVHPLSLLLLHPPEIEHDIMPPFEN